MTVWGIKFRASCPVTAEDGTSCYADVFSPGVHSYIPSLVNKLAGNADTHPCNKYRRVTNNGTENIQLQAENNISDQYLQFIINKLRGISGL